MDTTYIIGVKFGLVSIPPTWSVYRKPNTSANTPHVRGRSGVDDPPTTPN